MVRVKYLMWPDCIIEFSPSSLPLSLPPARRQEYGDSPMETNPSRQAVTRYRYGDNGGGHMMPETGKWTSWRVWWGTSK